jgi:hypothetical protein
MWTCKQCHAEVEDDFEICWSCYSDKSASLSTFENIENMKEQVYFDKNISEREEPASISAAVRKSEINSAGTALKNIFYASILMILFTIAAAYVIINADNIKRIQLTYVVSGVGNLTCYVFILFNILAAGNHLENHR